MDNSYLLSAILPLISAILCVTFYGLWRRQRERIHVLNWSLAYACAVLGSSIGLARLVLENAAPFSLVANAFLVGVAFFAVRGILLRHAGRSADAITLPIYLATILGGFWFGFVDVSVIGRGTVSSIGAAVMFLIATRAIQKADAPDSIDRLTALTFLLTAATLIGRPVVTYLYEGPVSSEAMVTGSLWGVSFRVFAMMSWCAMAVLFLLRTTTDLMRVVTAQSLADQLTGIANRRGFFVAAEALIETVTPDAPGTLLLCDIDQFKRVNDSYGHSVGDTVIQELADVLRQVCEKWGGTVGRLGGEEFVAFLPATPLDRARTIAEAIRTRYAARPHGGIPDHHIVTVSIGIATTTGEESLDSMIERADGALYRAKDDGRNRVAVAATEAIPFPGPALPRGASEIRRRGRAAKASRPTDAPCLATDRE
jgi:diguanylate cyclase (GGDEF)-like protein